MGLYATTLDAINAAIHCVDLNNAQHNYRQV